MKWIHHEVDLREENKRRTTVNIWWSFQYHHITKQPQSIWYDRKKNTLIDIYYPMDAAIHMGLTHWSTDLFQIWTSILRFYMDWKGMWLTLLHARMHMWSVTQKNICFHFFFSNVLFLFLAQYATMEWFSFLISVWSVFQLRTNIKPFR